MTIPEDDIRYLARILRQTMHDRYADCPMCLNDIDAAITPGAWEAMAEAAIRAMRIAWVQNQMAASGHPSGRHG